ncbi:MAG: hypothetical protein MI919_08930 [Holophagales bacterium]|nr:hypothetical protein [Holophagales bacterium]
MNERHLILERRIRKDLEVLREIWQVLEALDREASGSPGLEADPRDVVYAGYQVHNLYNAAENIFQNVARAFGNDVGTDGRWHAELLDRMRLDLSPLRPALIDDPTYEQLDEIRRFRHVFRAAYGSALDPERLALVRRQALGLRHRLPAQIESFLRFVEGLEG